MSSDLHLSTSETSPSSPPPATVDGTTDQVVNPELMTAAPTPPVESPPQETVQAETPEPQAAPDPAAPAASASAATPPPEPDPPVAPAPLTTSVPAVDPVIAERITIPGGHSSDVSSGGEWDLLTSKIKDWFDANDIGDQIQQARQPLRLLAIFIALLLVLKVYSGLLSAIGTIPLAPRLLQLVGLCSAISFSATRLVRSEERRQVLEGLRQRWTAFSGSKR